MVGRLLGIVLLGFTTAACTATVTLPPYTAVTSSELTGNIVVQDFIFTPPGRVAQNEIRENAAGQIFLTEPVGQYFSNAIRREFRQAGISLRDGACRLTGQVHDFATESLGFEVTYITDVTYRLLGAGESMVLERNIKVRFKTSKFVNAQLYLVSINKAIADNIGQFMADPQFIDALSGICAPPQANPPRRAAPRS